MKTREIREKGSGVPRTFLMFQSSTLHGTMRKYPKGTRSDNETPDFVPTPDSFYVIFPLFLDFIYIHEYANIGPLDEWTCQIVSLITDDITTCNSDNMELKLKPVYVFSGVSYFFNIHEIANFANKVICKSDHEIKDLQINFNLVPILVVYDT